MLSPIWVGMSTDTIFVHVLLGIVDISLGIVSWSFLEGNLTADFLFLGILQSLYSIRMSYNNCFRCVYFNWFKFSFPKKIQNGFSLKTQT